MDVLLTNDDGIDAVGLSAMYNALCDITDVTVVAPATDQSAVGRQVSKRADLHEHDLGYAVDGTPTDCILAGLGALDVNPDLVVAGCNTGANLGAYVLGRSGTVSAAVEAAFYGIPAIAASVYFPVGDISFESISPEPADFLEATDAVRYLIKHGTDAGIFTEADYLNVNTPLPTDESPVEMEITQPSHIYDMDADRDGSTIHIYDRIWDRMASGDITDPPGSDRRAIVEGQISVSPLTVPHTTTHHDALDALAAAYPR